jgi:pimeloyl-ACP methyl ester carboxylesterase
LLLVAFPLLACAHEERYEAVPSRENVTVPVWLVVPPQPVAAVILFAGGGGNIGVSPGGIERGNNFLVRTRGLFADAGFVAAVVDVPSDRHALHGFRTSARHAEDIAAVIAFLRREYSVPVWLVGTSRGTISAANGAARISPGGPDGIVLSSTVSLPSNAGDDSVRDVRLKDITVPVLFLHHEDDGCYVTPAHEIKRVARKLKKSAKVERLDFSGGRNEDTNECKAKTYHGFLGIENQVVGAIASWIKTR